MPKAVSKKASTKSNAAAIMGQLKKSATSRKAAKKNIASAGYDVNITKELVVIGASIKAVETNAADEKIDGSIQTDSGIAATLKVELNKAVASTTSVQKGYVIKMMLQHLKIKY